MPDTFPSLPPLAITIAASIGLLLLAVIANIVAKRLILNTVSTLARRSKFLWDDELVEHKVFRRLVHLIPALLVFSGAGFVPGLPADLTQLIRNVATGYMVLMLTFAVVAALAAGHAIYAGTPAGRTRPLLMTLPM